MQKTDPQMNGFAVAKKLQPNEKTFFKNPSSLLVKIRSSKRCAEFLFEINGFRDI